MKLTPADLILDLEISSRCNATCDYCPREKLELGHMTQAVYDRVLERIAAMPIAPEIHLCGKGDPSVHPLLVNFVQQAASRGYKVFITTNGRLVTADIGRQLIDAGLAGIFFSVATLPELYDDFYGLPFAVVQQNILDFNALAAGRCRCVVSISHKSDEDKGPRKLQKAYWQAQGITDFLVIHFHNRAAIYTASEAEQFDQDYTRIRDAIRQHRLDGLCFSPFKVINVNWDGSYQICANDFTMQSRLGHIDQMSIHEAQLKRLAYFKELDIVCKRCNVYHRTFGPLLADPSPATLQQYLDMEQLLHVLAESTHRA